MTLAWQAVSPKLLMRRAVTSGVFAASILLCMHIPGAATAAAPPGNSSEGLTHVEIRAQVTECRAISVELSRLYEDFYERQNRVSPGWSGDRDVAHLVWERVRLVPNYIAVLQVEQKRRSPSQGVLTLWEGSDRVEHAFLSPELGPCEEGRSIHGVLFRPFCDTMPPTPQCILQVKTVMPAPDLRTEDPQRELLVSFEYYNRVRWQSLGAGLLVGGAVGTFLSLVVLRGRRKSRERGDGSGR